MFAASAYTPDLEMYHPSPALQHSLPASSSSSLGVSDSYPSDMIPRSSRRRATHSAARFDNDERLASKKNALKMSLSPSLGSLSALEHLPLNDLELALRLSLLDVDGDELSFMDILEMRERTVVIFIRHPHYGACADYVQAVNALPFDRLHRLRVNVVLVSCGAPSLLKSNQASHDVQVNIFTDPTAKLQSTLGMLKSLSPRSVGRFMGIKSEPFDGLSAVNETSPSTSEPTNQLGGEFVFERRPPGSMTAYRCIYANRMVSSRSHGRLEDAFAALGIDIGTGDDK